MTIYEDSLHKEEIGEAWQYKRRLECAEEESANPYWEEFDLDIQASIVREISYTEAKQIIEKYEWLGCLYPNHMIHRKGAIRNDKRRSYN